MSMIDKLEVRVPRPAPFTRTFAQLYRELAEDDTRRSVEGQPMRIRASRYYLGVVDLRDFGHDVILHSFARLGKNGDHKVELVDTGDMSFSRMVYEISQIFDIDPELLAIMRVDLTANIPDIPVPWFVAHCRVQYKRWLADIGHIEYFPEYSEMGMRVVQTFYLGKRPNVYRIYDKIAEYEHQYKQLSRRLEPGVEVPTFEELYGYARNTILTRVERQLAAGRVPPTIDTVKKLRSAASFNPFDRLRITNGSEGYPQPYSYRSDVYKRGIAVQELIREQGYQRARNVLNMKSKGNADRILKMLHEFIPADEYRLTDEQLFERYRDSVSRQLAT